MLDNIKFVGGTEEQNKAMKDKFVSYAAQRLIREEKKAAIKPREVRSSLEDHPQYAEKIALHQEIASLKKAIEKNKKQSAAIFMKEHNPTLQNHTELLHKALSTCPKMIKLHQEYNEMRDKYNEAAVKFNAIVLD